MKAFEDHLALGESQKAKEVLEHGKTDIGLSVYWFNMGRLHAEEASWADARIAFLKSWQIQPRSETRSNLEIVESKLLVSEVESPATIKDYLIHSTFFTGTQLALTLNLILLVLGLLAYKRSRNIKKFAFTLFLMLLLSGLSIWTRHWPWSVAEQEIPVFIGPSEIFDKVTVIPKGIKILGTEKDSWIKIIYPSRFEGWIKKENISEL